ncbi:MAG: hypothetical protein R2742_00545 [Micropruina glycogenica]
MLLDRVGDLKSAAFDNVEKIGAHNLDPYEEAICEYNRAFTAMSDKGIAVLRQRERSTDLIELVERLVNNIANTPKAAGSRLPGDRVHRAQFIEARVRQERPRSARKSAAALVVGSPSASRSRVWPRQQRCGPPPLSASHRLAPRSRPSPEPPRRMPPWPGSEEGPSRWEEVAQLQARRCLRSLAPSAGLAGATLLVSITLFAKKKFDNREAKQEALAAVSGTSRWSRAWTPSSTTCSDNRLRESLMASYGDALLLFGADFRLLAPGQRSQLAALVDNTKACAALLSTRIEQATDR